MSGRTRKKSPHNFGRKPLYKEHRQHLVLETADTILARGPRYWDGVRLNQGLNWSDADHAALFTLCGAGSEIEACADTLARSPRTLAHRALDIGIRLPTPWWRFALSPRRWQARQDAESRREERREERRAKRETEESERTARREARMRGPLQYPYLPDSTPESIDLLSVNALVPKGLPEWIRADICQNIMLAVLEGETTLTQLKEKRESSQYYIKRFYREEVDHNLVSFDHRDDERAYDEIAGAMSREDWSRSEINDRRRAYSALETFVHPVQLGAVYNAEIRRAQKHAHESGQYLSYRETERAVSDGEVKVRDDAAHAIKRAAERYGLAPTTSDIRAMESAIRSGKSTFVARDPKGERHLVAHGDKTLHVAYKPTAGIIMSVLPQRARVQRSET